MLSTERMAQVCRKVLIFWWLQSKNYSLKNKGNLLGQINDIEVKKKENLSKLEYWGLFPKFSYVPAPLHRW